MNVFSCDNLKLQTLTWIINTHQSLMGHLYYTWCFIAKLLLDKKDELMFQVISENNSLSLGDFNYAY